MKKFTTKKTGLLLVTAILLMAFIGQTIPAYAASVTCPPIKDKGGNDVVMTGSGTNEWVTIEAVDSWLVPDMAGLYATWRGDLMGVDYKFQPRQEVPAGRSTLHGCAIAGDETKESPKDPVVAGEIPGAALLQAHDKAGKLEKAVWVFASQAWVVPADSVADVWGGKRYSAGETVPANSVATLFGWLMPSGYGSCPYISGVPFTNLNTNPASVQYDVPESFMVPDGFKFGSFQARKIATAGKYTVSCDPNAANPFAAPVQVPVVSKPAAPDQAYWQAFLKAFEVFFADYFSKNPPPATP